MNKDVTMTWTCVFSRELNQMGKIHVVCSNCNNGSAIFFRIADCCCSFEGTETDALRRNFQIQSTDAMSLPPKWTKMLDRTRNSQLNTDRLAKFTWYFPYTNLEIERLFTCRTDETCSLLAGVSQDTLFITRPVSLTDQSQIHLNISISFKWQLKILYRNQLTCNDRAIPF
jgi:hypothetical protein